MAQTAVASEKVVMVETIRKAGKEIIRTVFYEEWIKPLDEIAQEGGEMASYYAKTREIVSAAHELIEAMMDEASERRRQEGGGE